MSTIAAVQTQADLLIKGSAPPNDHFLHPKPLPRMPFEMKYEERRHLSSDPRVKKQIIDESQFQNTIVQTIWSDKISKFAPTMQERWMTAVDMERLMLNEGVTNPRLRGKACDVFDTSSVVFASSSASHTQTFSSSVVNPNNSNTVLTTCYSYQNPQMMMLKKGMNINNFMTNIYGAPTSSNNDPIFGGDSLSGNCNNNNNTTSSNNNSRPSTTNFVGNNNGNDDDTNYGKLSSSVPSFLTTTSNNNNIEKPPTTNLARMTNLRNEMRWNGIVVCKQIHLLLTDPERQDDFIGACFDRFDRNDPSKRSISKNLLLNTNLQKPEEDEAPPETFRWFETIAPPENAKKIQKNMSTNPKILKEMQKYLETQRKKMEEESTFVLPDIPTGKKKKRAGGGKRRRKKNPQDELPIKMMSGATYHQLEPLKQLIQSNEIGNQFYPHLTYEDFKEAFLNPKNSVWVSSFLGVLFEAMASYCSPVNDFSTTASVSVTNGSNNSNNDNTENSASSMLASTSRLFASPNTPSTPRGPNTNATSSFTTASASTTTSSSAFSSRSAPLPALPWMTKTLQTVPSAQMMADADVFLLLQLERAGGSSTDPVEKKKRVRRSSASSSSANAQPSTSLRDQARNKAMSSRSREDLFSASSSAASEFLSTMSGGGKKTSPTSALPTITTTTGASSSSKNPGDFFITSTNNTVPTITTSSNDDTTNNNGGDDLDGTKKRSARVRFV